MIGQWIHLNIRIVFFPCVACCVTMVMLQENQHPFATVFVALFNWSISVQTLVKNCNFISEKFYVKLKVKIEPQRPLAHDM